MAKVKKQDHFFFFLILALIIGGFAIFSSAALGQVGKTGADFNTVVFKQLLILLGGLVLLVVTAKVPYQHLKKISPLLFLLALGVSLLVFVPGLGMMHNGAWRWIRIGDFTWQPAEFLKFAFIIFLAAWASVRKEKIKTLNNGLLPFICFLAIIGSVMFFQKDTGTLMVVTAGALGIFISAGARFSHLLILSLIGLLAFAGLVLIRPHVRDRIETFLDPSRDERGSSYQINQSLIAIGSGGFWGKGFGQSVQKFSFLPEPIGDSIFAVAAEEFGFLGSTLIVLLFLLFILYGYHLANKEKDAFGRLLVIGFITAIGAQAFINIGAMLGLLPLTGVPLPFVSHGGTALLFSLIQVGIILNITQQKKVN